MLSTVQFISNHPLRRQQALRGLGAYLKWQIASRLTAETEFAWVDGAKLIARRGMTSVTGNIYCGLYEFTEMAFLLHVLRPGQLFLDIGANIGSFTVLASKVCGARSVSFEPDQDTAKNLRRNIALNGIESLVTVEEAALGAEDGVANFSVGRDTVNHVVDDPSVPVRRVVLKRLDGVAAARAPTLIKIDVEGYEEQVLAGAGEILSSPSLLAVQSELNSPAVQQAFESRGFRQMYYDPFGRKLSAAPLGYQSWNALFVRDADAVARLVASAPYRRILGRDI
ncbi:MAG TPA: FkbM family methyltransferase [Rhizomicrobium sp.]|jgi:FkbM family methyltransferase|nr:FkbM family methyltransferase [Rhizomicrobium sp.]